MQRHSQAASASDIEFFGHGVQTSISSDLKKPGKHAVVREKHQ